MCHDGRSLFVSCTVLGLLTAGFGTAAERFSVAERIEYRVLATKKTSTMEKELNQAAAEGFRFNGVMGGGTAFGGSEVVVVLSKLFGPSGQKGGDYEYKLLSTSKTSTMQKELQQSGDAGFEYKGQTVFESAFGGKEVVVILERDKNGSPQRWEYLVLATSKTSTMEKELLQAGEAGYDYVGFTVADTAVGGSELAVILRRPARK